MLDSMRLSNTLMPWLATLILGLWAGGAAAQTDEDGWFDGPESDRPVLRIQGKGPYDPPPADFQADHSAAIPNDADEQYATDVSEADESSDEVEDAESIERAQREFSPQLEPYGHWLDDPVYGRVWVPNPSVVGREFAPYASGGHWELTADDEWLWASDYPFGAVTFHYGRWAWLSAGSWGWVPGYRYAPAWVDFRVGAAGYVGWGPAPPYSVWRHGAFVSLGVVRPLPFVFCPTTYVFSRSMPRYVIRDRHRVRSIAAETYRYRPYRVAGARVSRGPTPTEARIPRRALPARRVVARPRYADSGDHRVRSTSQRELRSAGVNRGSRNVQNYSRRDSGSGARQQVRRTPYNSGRDERSRNRGERFEPRVAPRSNNPGTSERGRQGAAPARWRDGADVRSPRDVRGSGNSGWGDRERAGPTRAAPREQRGGAAPAATRREGPSRASGGERRGETRSSRGAPARGRSRDTQRSPR